MANQETQLLDDIIVSSRRKMLSLGVASIAGLVLASSTRSAKAAATYTDNDILNFALNLEYLEANFYYLAAFGCTIDKPNMAAQAAGAPTAGIPITISGGGVGTAGTVTGGSQVPFATVTVGSYATETAIEEGQARPCAASGARFRRRQPASDQPRRRHRRFVRRTRSSSHHHHRPELQPLRLGCNLPRRCVCV